MKKLFAGIALAFVLLYVAMNTSMLSKQALDWADLHAKDPLAPKVLFWTGWWGFLLGDSENSEKLFLQLYQRYPQENAMVAEGLYHVAEMREQSTTRLSCLDFCNIIIEKYPSEEKWRFQAAKLHDQVINNVR